MVFALDIFVRRPLLRGAACLLAATLAAAPASAQRLDSIAVVESIPGGIWDEHEFFAGMQVRHTHPESATIRYNWHAGAVAARIFEAPPGSTSGVSAGLADRERWELWSYQAQTTSVYETAWQEVAKNARVANHSVGYLTSVTGESTRARAIDRAAYEGRVLVTQAAFNDGPEPQTLRDPAGGYNLLAVAASGPESSPPDPDYLRGVAEGAYVAWYSSRGPTDDGRAKPDVTAPGTFIDLPNYDVESLDPTALRATAGTSFAAPYLAGMAAALIEQADDQGMSSDPLVLKSVILNSAQEVRQAMTSAAGELVAETWDGWSPDNTSQPLDYDQGAGEASYPRAELQYFSHGEQPPSLHDARLAWDLATAPEAGDAIWYQFDGPVHAGATLTATLAWFREFSAAGSPQPLDDFDLELWRTNGVEPLELITLSNSRIDSVEHLHRFAIPEPGYYSLAIRLTADAFAASTPNAYAVAWSLPESNYLTGDLDLDGDVDMVDFSTLASQFGSGDLPGDGDLDGDRDVDLADFSAMKSNFGEFSRTPEPRAWQLAAAAMGVVGSTSLGGRIRRPRAPQ